MKWRKTILVLAAMSVIVGAVYLLFLRREPEPSYQGKTVLEWTVQLVSDPPRMDPEAVAALRAMGHPAVRRLIEIVEKRDSEVTKQLLALSTRVPMVGEFVNSSYWPRYLAAKALGAIGPDARTAVPALERMAQDSDKNLSRVAEGALVLVKAEPIGAYVAQYFEPSRSNYAKAFGLLLELGLAAKEAVPQLLSDLQSTNSRARTSAMIVLGYVGVNSKECVPQLLDILQSDNHFDRQLALSALANFGALAKPAHSNVLAALKDEASGVRSSALMVIERTVAAEDFGPFREAVQSATNDSDSIVRDLAAMVLKTKGQIDAPK